MSKNNLEVLQPMQGLQPFSQSFLCILAGESLISWWFNKFRLFCNLQTKHKFKKNFCNCDFLSAKNPPEFFFNGGSDGKMRGYFDPFVDLISCIFPVQPIIFLFYFSLKVSRLSRIKVDKTSLVSIGNEFVFDGFFCAVSSFVFAASYGSGQRRNFVVFCWRRRYLFPAANKKSPLFPFENGLGRLFGFLLSCPASVWTSLSSSPLFVACPRPVDELCKRFPCKLKLRT